MSTKRKILLAALAFVLPVAFAAAPASAEVTHKVHHHHVTVHKVSTHHHVVHKKVVHHVAS